MANTNKGKNSREINIEYVSPVASGKKEKSIMRASILETTGISEISPQKRYDEITTIIGDLRKQAGKVINLKGSFKDSLEVGLTKIQEKYKMEIDKNKYMEIQIQEDRESYRQDVLAVERDYTKKLERLIETKITIDSKDIVNGIKNEMRTWKEEMKNEIILEIAKQNKKSQGVSCTGKEAIQDIIPEIRKEIEKINEAPLA